MNTYEINDDHGLRAGVKGSLHGRIVASEESGVDGSTNGGGHQLPRERCNDLEQTTNVTVFHVHLRIRKRLAPCEAKCENCATGGLTPVPLKLPSVAWRDELSNGHYGTDAKVDVLTTLKSYPAVLTPPRRGRTAAVGALLGVLAGLATVLAGAAAPGMHWE